MQEFMPVFLRVKGRPALIVGGGNVALRKANMLAAAGADLVIIALDIHESLRAMPGVRCEIRPVSDEDITPDLCLAILATDDAGVQEHVASLCRKRGILCNRCDLPEGGDFVTGGVINRDPILAAVTASGVPAMARLVRERFEKTLEPALLELAGLLEEIRPRLKESGVGDERKAEFFRRWASEIAVEEVRRRGIDAVREEVLKCLSC